MRCRRQSVDRTFYGRGSAVNTCTGASHARIHSASPHAASGTLSSFPTTRARPPSALAAKAAQARGDHHPWPCNASPVRNSFGRATARPHSRRSTGAPIPRPTGSTPAQHPSPLTAANQAQRGPRLVQPPRPGRPPRPSPWQARPAIGIADEPTTGAWCRRTASPSYDHSAGALDDWLRLRGPVRRVPAPLSGFPSRRCCSPFPSSWPSL